MPERIAVLLVTDAIAWVLMPVESVREASLRAARALTYSNNAPLSLGQSLGPHETFYSWTWSLAVVSTTYAAPL